MDTHKRPMSRRIGQDPDSRMRRMTEWREARRKEWWEGDRRERENEEKQGGGEWREDDKRVRDGTCMGAKEVGGGGSRTKNVILQNVPWCVLLCFIKPILGNQCTVPGFLDERAKGARTHD